MSRLLQIIVVLIIGISIGISVPFFMQQWPVKTATSSEIQIVLSKPAEENYYFRLEDGFLSVVQGSSAASGKVILQGLEVDNWPQDLLGMAPKMEFHSLDEVQSFIDTVNEPLWIE